MNATAPTEAAILGAVLWNPRVVVDVFAALSPGDFSGPNAVVARVIHDLHHRGRVVDETTVLAALLDDGVSERMPGGAGSYLLTLRDEAVVPANVGEHVRLMCEHVARRRLWQVGTRITQRAENPDADVAFIATESFAEIEALTVPIGTPSLPAPTYADFALGQSEPDWLVEGLLERGERVIITGEEGRGKSQILRQIAVCVAAGQHPFSRAPREPRRVLLVDFENGSRQLRRELAAVVAAIEVRGTHVDPEFLRVLSHPAGLDISTGRDATWLHEKVAASSPDLLVIGPLYRMHRSDTREEPEALSVAATLDLIRNRVGCALAIETHAPHGGVVGTRNLRPIGSSVWLRWPEFGYGLRRVPRSDRKDAPSDFELLAWRGARELGRSWPRYLAKGNLAGGQMPWVEADDAPEWGRSRL